MAGYKYGSETEFDFRSALTFISTFARHSMPVTAAVCTSSRMGIHAVMHFGSEQMQRRYVDDCLGGRTSWSLCMSGPEAGSDLFGGATRATRAATGQWLLSGCKKWITGGWYADYFCVLARTDDPTAPRAGRDGFTMFVVPRSAAVVERMDCAGAAESGTARVVFDDVPLTDSDVIVEERWVSGITSLAMARHALEDTILLPMDSLALQLADRLTERRTTGTPSLELAGDCAGFKAAATGVLVDCLRHAMVLFGGRAFETRGEGRGIAALHTQAHGMECAGGTSDVLMCFAAKVMVSAL